MTAKKAIEVQKAETVKAEKAPAKKAASKKAAATTETKAKKEKSQNVYIQFAGKEILTADILQQVKQAWIQEGHRVSSVKSLDVYVKPEESAAYYVINGKETGKVEF